jgi:hypothetical protein
VSVFVFKTYTRTVCIFCSYGLIRRISPSVRRYGSQKDTVFRVQTNSAATSPGLQYIPRDFFSGERNGRIVNLVTHLNVMLRLRIVEHYLYSPCKSSWHGAYAEAKLYPNYGHTSGRTLVRELNLCRSIDVWYFLVFFSCLKQKPSNGMILH